ncbi:MAG: hypothetical protein JO202_16030 [Ktedonobacteraceae bacterium]|nr:hypothetical protein [Ktedonobacteraceae bacterium]
MNTDSGANINDSNNPFKLDVRIFPSHDISHAHAAVKPASPATCQTCRESQCSWSVITTCWSCSAC